MRRRIGMCACWTFTLARSAAIASRSFALRGPMRRSLNGSPDESGGMVDPHPEADQKNAEPDRHDRGGQKNSHVRGQGLESRSAWIARSTTDFSSLAVLIRSRTNPYTSVELASAPNTSNAIGSWNLSAIASQPNPPPPTTYLMITCRYQRIRCSFWLGRQGGSTLIHGSSPSPHCGGADEHGLRATALRTF